MLFVLTTWLLLPQLSAETTSFRPRRCLPAVQNSGAKGTLRVAYFNWFSSKLYNTVGAIVLSDIMGYDVELVMSENSGDVYKTLHEKKADITFEVWGFNKKDRHKLFVEGGDAMDLGKLTVAGRDGWYVPDYVAKKHDAANFYPFFGTQEGQHLFGRAVAGSPKVAATECKEPQYRCARNATFLAPQCRTAADCPVPLLRRVPSLAMGVNEQLVTNLGLNLSVAYLGAGFDRFVWQAYAAQQPVLFYWWAPGDTIAGIPYTRFKRVSLPPRSSEDCSADMPTGTLDGPSNCDWPWQTLTKCGHRSVADNPELLHFAQHFDIRDVDHEFFVQQPTDDTDFQSAACLWVQQHRDVWSHWVMPTFFVAYMLPDYWKEKQSCAVLAIVQIVAGT